MKLIVGLGNVGKEYENTRHNIGFMVLDNYLQNVNYKEEKLAYIYQTIINNEKVLFIKPKTLMNLSGLAVKYYLDYYKINVNDLLVIQDDLDMEVGKIRIKRNSSSGGHNGIKNIIENIGTSDFIRLKIGISKPTYDTIDYVLGKFSKLQFEKIQNSYIITNNIITDFISNIDYDFLMNRYN